MDIELEIVVEQPTEKKPLKPVNLNLDQVTIADIENHKNISALELDKDLERLIKFPANTNKNNFFGNPFLYHFQFKNLLNCKRLDGKTIYDIWNDQHQWDKLIDHTRHRNRGGRTAAGNVFECFRINLGSVVMFKASTAKYIYKKYGASKVLDPTAGWGGRMLGAWSLGIDYTGIDTNVDLIPAYDSMIDYLNSHSKKVSNNQHCNQVIETITSSKLNMIWNSCLDVDFSTIDYDFVLTSPPYVNLELYPHMSPWKSNEEFYLDFFIPMWTKCIANINPGGHVCMNISPRMYDDAVKFGLPVANVEEDLLQQMGQKMSALEQGRKKQDKIYIWKIV